MSRKDGEPVYPVMLYLTLAEYAKFEELLEENLQYDYETYVEFLRQFHNFSESMGWRQR